MVVTVISRLQSPEVPMRGLGQALRKGACRAKTVSITPSASSGKVARRAARASKVVPISSRMRASQPSLSARVMGSGSKAGSPMVRARLRWSSAVLLPSTRIRAR